MALTAYLALTAFGVLAGGFIADMTERHAEVAAVSFVVNAVLVLAIGMVGLGSVLLVATMGLAGFLSGMIMPSRDMLVRAGAPSASSRWGSASAARSGRCCSAGSWTTACRAGCSGRPRCSCC